MPVELTVVGSINLDLVARVERLPRAGETLVGHDFVRVPGGKGANQAVAAARLGARVRDGRRGRRRPARRRGARGLRDAGVELELARAGTTGIALILVDDAGENQIVVVPGANAHVPPTLARRRGALPARGAGRGRAAAAAQARRSSRSTPRRRGRSTRARPADREPARARGRLARQARRGHLRRRGRGALRERTRGGARDAASRRRRRRHRGRRRVRRVPRRLAARGPRPRARHSRARAPPARSPPRDSAHNLRSPPQTTSQRYSPHDPDADHPRLRSRATTTRSRSCSPSPRPSSTCGRSRPSPATRRSTRRRTTRCACSSSPAAPTSRSTRAPTDRSCGKRDVAAHVHGESGLDGPDLPQPSQPRRTSTPSSSSREQYRARGDKPTLVATGPLTNVGLLFATHPDARPERDRPDGRRDRRGEPHARGRVQHLGRPRGGAARLRRGSRHDDGRARRHAPRADQGRAHRADARRRTRREGRRGADGLLRALPQAPLPGPRRLADARSGVHRAPRRPDADGRARRVHRGRLHDRAELGADERRLARPRALRRAEREGRPRHRRRAVRGAASSSGSASLG